MNLPKVTILTAAYNASPYLDRYFQGVCAQDIEELQILFIDDGSTDETLARVRWFQLNYDSKRLSIVTLHQSNQGPHVAMNYGLQFASGELILPLDADDMLLPGAVEAFVTAFAQNPEASLAYSDFRRCDQCYQPLPVTPERRNWVRTKNLLHELLIRGMFIPAGAYCYHRRCLEFLPHKKFTPEFHAQNLELLLHAAANTRCVYVPKETVELLRRRESRSSAATLERLHRKVTGSHVLQRQVARQYRVPFFVRMRLEARLLPLELDYYFLCGKKSKFLSCWVKAVLLRVVSRKHILEFAATAFSGARETVIRRYFANYQLDAVALP